MDKEKAFDAFLLEYWMAKFKAAFPDEYKTPIIKRHVVARAQGSANDALVRAAFDAGYESGKAAQ